MSARGFPSKETVLRIKEQYPPGTRVELICMDDPYSKLKPGDQGTVLSWMISELFISTGTAVLLWV